MNQEINTPFIQDESQRKVLENAMHGRLKYTLMNDFLAKYSLQKDLYALKGLLAALLRLELDEITAIEVMNPVEPAEYVSDKNCMLDIKLELNDSTIINIEIQSRFQDFWPERSLTYLCRNFDHLKDGETYRKLKPCIQIGILDNNLFREDDPRYTGEFYSEYAMLNKKTHTEYSSKFSIRVLSLTHVENATPEDKDGSNGLYYWAKLFKAKSWEELKMIAKDNPRMESFVGTVRRLSAEEKISQACESRRRYMQDIATYEGDLEEKRQQIEVLDQQIVELNEQHEDLNQQLEQKNQQIEEKNQQIEEKNQQIEEKDQQIEEKDQQIEEKNLQLEEKDQTILELQRKLEEMMKQQ